MELIRSLQALATTAQVAIDAADAQLALNEEKLEIIKTQISEARGMYRQGRLEFQDFLQHWAAFEQVRFQQLDLLRVRWLAQLELVRVLGPTPSMCEVGS